MTHSLNLHDARGPHDRQLTVTTISTMAKRLVSPNSDDEDAQDASPAFKRARTDGASDIEPNNRSQRRGPRNKGKGRAPGEDGNSSSDDDQEPEVHADHIDDDQFEEQYHERVEKAVDAKRHIVGVSCNDICSFLSSYGSCAAQGVAEHGIIESIEMHQFMCHRFLSFQFGPQINFIIGELNQQVLLHSLDLEIPRTQREYVLELSALLTSSSSSM